MQGDGQIGPQSFAGHFQDVIVVCPPRRKFQVHPGAAVQIEDVSRSVDEYTCLDDLPQQRLFSQFLQWKVLREGFPDDGLRDHRHFRRYWRSKPGKG